MHSLESAADHGAVLERLAKLNVGFKSIFSIF